MRYGEKWANVSRNHKGRFLSTLLILSWDDCHKGQKPVGSVESPCQSGALTATRSYGLMCIDGKAGKPALWAHPAHLSLRWHLYLSKCQQVCRLWQSKCSFSFHAHPKRNCVIPKIVTWNSCWHEATAEWCLLEEANCELGSLLANCILCSF